MSKPSAASLSIVPPVPAGEIAIPEGLSPVEVALWRDVVESKPAGWFAPDSAPVLKEYVRAVTTCDVLAEMLQGAMLSRDGDAIKRALDMRDKEAKRVASLATKLRLTQQSRYTPRAAASADAGVSGKRPWAS